jgi:hypothetical protein
MNSGTANAITSRSHFRGRRRSPSLGDNARRNGDSGPGEADDDKEQRDEGQAIMGGVQADVALRHQKREDFSR